MSPSELETYLHEQIPLSRALGVWVATASTDEVRLGAPLEPNLNHRDTAFGGSLAAAAILAGWALVHLRLRAEGRSDRVVIQRSEVDFQAPVDQAFEAAATAPDPGHWGEFLTVLGRRGRARLELDVVLRQGGDPVGRAFGRYVALDPGR